MKTEQIDATQDLPVMISDAWQSLHPFLKTLNVGAPEACRRFLSALIWITKEGATWRSLSLRILNAIYRFRQWCDAGVFEKLHEHFHEAGELSALLIDSTNSYKKTEVQKHSVEVAFCRGSDAFLPLRFTLTAGARHDVTQAPALIYTCHYIIADAAYDSDALDNCCSKRFR